MAELTELEKGFVEFFDCDYEYFPEGSDYGQVLARFAQCQKEGQQKGFTPVMVTVDDVLLEALQLSCEDESGNFSGIEDVRSFRKEVLEEPYSDGATILKKRLDSYVEDMAEDDFDFEELVGEYQQSNPLPSPLSITGDDEDSCTALFIVKVPVTEPWKIFAYLPMGGWNDCPTNREFMAISKHYYDKYQAVPVAMTHDVVEYEVAKPITTPEQAMDEAKMHYGMCSDILQNFDSLGLYAGTLVNSKFWYFWWD